jgi:hypothetical protein
MMRLLKSKKGYKTLITILALFFIALTFLVFLFLFSMGKNKVSGQIETSIAFISIDTELALKTFLQSPSKTKPSEIGYAIGDTATEADLLTRSCNQLRSSSVGKFTDEAKEYFNRIYEGKWHLELIFYTPSGDDEITPAEIKSVALGATARPFEIVKYTQSDAISKAVADMSDMTSLDIAFMKTNIRDRSLGSQTLPCKEGPSIVKLVLIQWKEADGKWP